MEQKEKTYFDALTRKSRSTANEEIFDEYVRFVEAFKQHMMSGGSKSDFDFKILLGRIAPGLRNLLLSLADQANADVRVEWNPLSQRVYVAGLQYEPSELMRSFSKVSNVLSTFVQIAHEAAHVLLWEPFFVGRFRPRSRLEFIDVSLCFEGFCFWYGDILITPKLRTYLPDGEFVFGRSHISQQHFHPYRAFKSLRMDDPEKIIEIYLDAFRGYKTELLDGMRDPFVADLSNRVYGFYSRTERPASLMYDRLKKSSVFTEFYKRFCDIPNLPSLFSRDLNELMSKSDPGEFALQVYRKGFAQIQQLSTENVKKVQVRRMLQTRAYAAMSVRYALEQDLYFSANGRAFNVDATLAAIRGYLEKLEDLLRKLASVESPTTVKAECKRADAFYDASVRRPLRSAEVWLKRKGLYFPTADTPRSEFGMIDPHLADPKEFEALTIHFLKTYVPSMNAKRKNNKNRDAGDMTNISALYEELAKRGWGQESAKRRFVKRFNRAITSGPILKQWSTPLWETDPGKNQFTELLFVYE